MVETAEKDQQDDDHEDVHHGQGGERHGCGVEGGCVFDVGGEKAEAAMFRGDMAILWIREEFIGRCQVVVIVGGGCCRRTQYQFNNRFNHSQE